MAKEFKGSLAVLIILVILCWPVGVIYYFMKREEAPPMRTCMKCGQQIPVQYSVCPYCQAPVGPMPQQQAYYPPQQQYPPQNPPQR